MNHNNRAPVSAGEVPASSQAMCLMLRVAGVFRGGLDEGEAMNRAMAADIPK
ncbi:hypothetical protein ACFLV1_02870 [Chloroflexota bacterium]